MGRFSTTTHIKNTTDRAGFIRAFGEVMAKRGFVPCAEDEAAKSFLLAFSEGGWVTFASESDDVPKIVADMNLTSLSVEVVDSDFAILQLHAPNGRASRVVVGDGEGYGVEKVPFSADDWKPLVRNGNIGEFVGAVNQENTFVEDTLCDVAPILGIDAKYIVEDYNELIDLAGNDEGVAAFHFKEAGTKDKPLTLNAAFVKVFGEALEPLGFKKIKSKYPYFVRVVPGGEIIHVISYRDDGSFNPKYKKIDIKAGIATVYRHKIDLSCTIKKQNWFNSNWELYPKLYGDKCDEKFRNSIYNFNISVDNEQMLADIKYALEITKQIMLPILDDVYDIDSCIEYHHKYKSIILWDESSNFGNDYPSCDDSEGFLYLVSDNKDIFRKRMKNAISEIALREKNFFERVQTDPKLYSKVQIELQNRKEANTEILRSYGLDV